MSSEDWVGLANLAAAFGEQTGESLSPFAVAYRVRQIHIGHGCLNQCSHCYAAAPATLEQMHHSSFGRLADEFGAAAAGKREPFPFLFLGASSDPAMLSDFALYAETWIRALPQWHPLKFYTHGWRLGNLSQRAERDAFLDVVASSSERIAVLGLSVDTFSRFARSDWKRYVANAGENLRAFEQVVPRTALKLNVTYPVCRLDVREPVTLGYWRELARRGDSFPDDRTVDGTLVAHRTPAERQCARLTAAVFAIGEAAGLNRLETAAIARDNGVPFPSGRAEAMFEGRPPVDVRRALARQQQHTLKSLQRLPFGNHGIVIMPDGRARLVDYLGYVLGPWLRDGEPVIPYARSWFRQHPPWRLRRRSH